MTAPRSKYRRQRDNTRVRQHLRAQDYRVQAALKEAREAEHRLDVRIEREAAAARAMLEARHAAATREQREAARAAARDAEARAAALREQWTLGFARQLVRRGYTLEHAVAFTGWPASMLDDVIPGAW